MRSHQAVNILTHCTLITDKWVWNQLCYSVLFFLPVQPLTMGRWSVASSIMCYASSLSAEEEAQCAQYSETGLLPTALCAAGLSRASPVPLLGTVSWEDARGGHGCHKLFPWCRRMIALMDPGSDPWQCRGEGRTTPERRRLGRPENEMEQGHSNNSKAEHQTKNIKGEYRAALWN